MSFTAIYETKNAIASANERLSASEAEKDIVEAEIQAYIESRRAERERNIYPRPSPCTPATATRPPAHIAQLPFPRPPPSEFLKFRSFKNRFYQGCHRKFEAARQHRIELEQLLAAQIQAPLADGTDVTEWLPDTLLDTILLFLGIRDMNRAGRVSKRWKRLVDSPRCQNFHRTLDVRMAK